MAGGQVSGWSGMKEGEMKMTQTVYVQPGAIELCMELKKTAFHMNRIMVIICGFETVTFPNRGLPGNLLSSHA